MNMKMFTYICAYYNSILLELFQRYKNSNRTTNCNSIQWRTERGGLGGFMPPARAAGGRLNSPNPPSVRHCIKVGPLVFLL
jgi:hypothetical protein